jgi:hypothetical protein
MKNRLYLALIANREKGFALPLAVLIGLILMGTGMTMIMRAQGDQSKVVAQKARADGLTSSESGVTRVQDLLNSVRVMATVDSHCTSGDCWQTAQVPSDNPSTDLQKDLKELDIATACGNPDSNDEIANKILAPQGRREENPGLRDLATREWFKLNDNRYYRVVGYDYTEAPSPTSSTSTPIMGWGVLTLEGLSLKGNLSNIDGDNAASRNRVVVTIPIHPSLPPAFNRTTAPALWVSEGATEDGSQTSRITASNPEYQNGADFQGDVVMSDTTTTTGFVEATGTLRPNLECHINENNIQQVASNNPNPPYQAQFIDVPFPSLPPIPTTLPPGQQNLELTSSQTFPRRDPDTEEIIDTPSTRTINGQSVQVYEYIVNNIDLNGNDEITITPGQKVVFYVRGNITGNGNGGIRHDCNGATGCKPGNLQIYAYNDPTVLGSAEPQICLRGREEIEAFIFAPAYSLGKTGNGAFVGAVWGKNWGKIQNCGSNNGAVAVTQGVEWTDLIQNLKPDALNTLPQLGNITNWCEEPIDTDPTGSQCVPNFATASPSPSP